MNPGQIASLSHTNTMVNLEPNMHVFGLQEEAVVPGEYPHRHRDNMQTPTQRGPQLAFLL